MKTSSLILLILFLLYVVYGVYGSIACREIGCLFVFAMSIPASILLKNFLDTSIISGGPILLVIFLLNCALIYLLYLFVRFIGRISAKNKVQ